MDSTNFPTQQQQYNNEEIQHAIFRLQKTYDNEVQLGKMLTEKKTEEKIEAAKKFVEQNGKTIEDQLAQIVKLDTNIRTQIKENRGMQNLDEDFNKLIQQEEFQVCAQNMKKVRASIENIKDFLCENGVQGYQV